MTEGCGDLVLLVISRRKHSALFIINSYFVLRDKATSAGLWRRTARFPRPAASKAALLTREDDHDWAEQQVDGRLPPLWHALHHGRDEDLCGDVELQGEGNEDTEAVEQLHDLVRPGKRQRGGGILVVLKLCFSSVPFWSLWNTNSCSVRGK